MSSESIIIDLEYPGADDGGEYLAELEDLIALAVNKFRARHPECEVSSNGVS